MRKTDADVLKTTCRDMGGSPYYVKLGSFIEHAVLLHLTKVLAGAPPLESSAMKGGLSATMLRENLLKQLNNHNSENV